MKSPCTRPLSLWVWYPSEEHTSGTIGANPVPCQKVAACRPAIKPTDANFVDRPRSRILRGTELFALSLEL